MKKKIFLLILITLLAVSIVSAGLLDEAKKSQKNRKEFMDNYKSTSSFTQKTNSVFYKPTEQKLRDFPKKEETPIAKKEVIIKENKNVMKPGEKINLGNSILIISKTLPFETKITDQGKEMDFGYFKLIIQGDLPTKDDPIEDPAEKVGFTSPTGAPVKNIKKQPVKTQVSPTKGFTAPTGAAISPIREYRKNTQKFKVSNPKKVEKKGFLNKLRGRGITSPTGAATRESKEKPRILEKLKELFSR